MICKRKSLLWLMIPQEQEVMTASRRHGGKSRKQRKNRKWKETAHTQILALVSYYLHLSSLPKEFRQPRTKCTNRWLWKRHFHSIMRMSLRLNTLYSTNNINSIVQNSKNMWDHCRNCWKFISILRQIKFFNETQVINQRTILKIKHSSNTTKLC